VQLAQVRRLHNLENLGLSRSQVADALNDFRFLHFEESARTMFAQDDLAQGHRPFIWILSVPPVVQEKRKKLCRDCSLAT
jgi:hypothetical protein